MNSKQPTFIMKNQRFKSYIPFLLLLLSPIVTALALVPSLPKKLEKEKTERNKSSVTAPKSVCCELDDKSEPGLRLARICQGEKDTRFIFKYDVPSAGACEILENVTLEDDSGKKYKGVGSQGIPRCGAEKRWKVEEFVWVFEKMDSGSKYFNLYEKDLEGMPGWKWNQVDLSHCKF